MSQKVITTVEKLAIPIIDAENLELVDIEYKKEGSNWFLRVFIDKDGGVDLEDCGRVSEALSNKLDEVDPIPSAYFLEVSSPGAERPLKKEKDFTRAVGKHVYMTTYEPIHNEKVFEGKLVNYDPDHNLLVIEQKGKEFELPLDKIASARLAVVF